MPKATSMYTDQILVINSKTPIQLKPLTERQYCLQYECEQDLY